MHKKIPKICTGFRVSEAKIYLYNSTEIAKARPHSEEWQTDTSVQKQWSMVKQNQQVFKKNNRSYLSYLFRSQDSIITNFPKVRCSNQKQRLFNLREVKS